MTASKHFSDLLSALVEAQNNTGELRWTPLRAATGVWRHQVLEASKHQPWPLRGVRGKGKGRVYVTSSIPCRFSTVHPKNIMEIPSKLGKNDRWIQTFSAGQWITNSVLQIPGALETPASVRGGFDDFEVVSWNLWGRRKLRESFIFHNASQISWSSATYPCWIRTSNWECCPQDVDLWHSFEAHEKWTQDASSHKNLQKIIRTAAQTVAQCSPKERTKASCRTSSHWNEFRKDVLNCNAHCSMSQILQDHPCWHWRCCDTLFPSDKWVYKH